MNGEGFGMVAVKNGSNGETLRRSNITHALQIIHDSRSDNDSRQKASEFLEAQKRSNEAAGEGYCLAADSTQPPVVRHFGLSLIEHAVRHHWHSISNAQDQEIRKWTINLAQSITEHDPLYLRNKVAQLFIELAKKEWAVSWYDMDSSLLLLWKQNSIYKEFVLTVLENISEDVFTREDSAAGVRGQDLNNAVVEIFTPASNFAGGQSKGHPRLRADEDGWLARISGYLLSTAQITSNEESSKVCICKALATLRTAFTWIMGPAIISTHCVESISACLVSADSEILLAAIEALHSLYGRTHIDDPEFAALVRPMYSTDSISLLRKLYGWAAVECHDIETTKYTFVKKFSETIAFLAGHLEVRKASELSLIDLSEFLRFTIGVVQHPSLIVSIPVLHSWVRILKAQHTGNLEATWLVIGALLDTASQRIIRYELFPEDSDDPSIIFLNEDVDTIPERHAFLGNYRRFCYQVIEIVAQRKPRGAIPHILSQVDISLDQISTENSELNPATYTKSSASLLRLDAHLTVVEAALKGYSKWVAEHGKEPQKYEEDRNFLESNVESWAGSLLTGRKYDDPLMKQRIIKLAVECSARALENNQAFALRVLEHILLTQTADQPQYPAYSEAVKELQVYATSELRRLAARHADYFATFYDQLEAKIRDVLSASSFDEKAEAEMYGTLLIVLQRATNVDAATRDSRLQSLIGSVIQGWQSEGLDQALSSFGAFCAVLGIDRVGPYLQSRKASGITDWSIVDLDAAGLSIQKHMQNFVSQVPLRMIKTALGVMTEKIAADSPPYQIAVNIWSPQIPMLIPKILRLVQYAHRLHDVETWPNLTPDVQPAIARVLQDRFWQAGISSGSRDEFYSRVTNTKSTLEGFASFVRGRIRLVREASYQILHSMSRLRDHFYSYSELPEPLAESLIGSTTNLSSHQFSVLLQMVRSMVHECPFAHRQHFLPPILSTLFRQMDHKISTEWDKIDRRKVDNTGEENLTLEMKEESILRQLTNTAVTFVAVLLDPYPNQNQQHPSDSTQPHPIDTRPTNPSLRTFILTTPSILEPLLVFCTHILTTPDSRSTSTTARVLGTIVPAFAALSPTTSIPDSPTTTAIREYFCTSILKAVITSLNDGYFADLQKELASLIANIWIAYGCMTHFPAVTAQNADGDTQVVSPAHDRPPLSSTPRDIVLSLPGMTPERVDAVAAALTATGGVGGNSRQRRALVLDLLDGLRGVRISELGKISTSADEGGGRVAEKSSKLLQERYMRADGGGEQGAGGGEAGVHGGQGMEGVEGKVGGGGVEDGPELGGVADLLG